MIMPSIHCPTLLYDINLRVYDVPPHIRHISEQFARYFRVDSQERGYIVAIEALILCLPLFPVVLGVV